MKIQELNSQDELPLELLLEADPDQQAVQAYCATEKVFLAKDEGDIIAVYVLELSQTEKVAEILNISVAAAQQGKGIGKTLIQHAISTARSLDKSSLLVGTGNSSIGQIAFYQKCGFEISGIIKNYFVDRYEEEIFEHGIQCKHMIRFEMNLEM